MTNCPACHAPASSEHIHERLGVATAHYLCANGHGWLVRWALEVPA